MSDAKYSRSIYIEPSFCDMTGKLGTAETFALFMDIASEHAEVTGIGTHAMGAKGLFWLTTKTKIHFNRHPEMMEVIEASTWPQELKAARVIRDYALEKDGELVAAGKTEWAVLEIRTGRLHNIYDNVYNENTKAYERNVLEEPFTKFNPDFSDGRPIGEYTINSQDTDFGGHTNNAAYPRIFLSMYAGKELTDMNITDMEVIFKAPCYEGNKVLIYERRAGNSRELGMFDEAGKVISYCKIN